MKQTASTLIVIAAIVVATTVFLVFYLAPSTSVPQSPEQNVVSSGASDRSRQAEILRDDVRSIDNNIWQENSASPGYAPGLEKLEKQFGPGSEQVASYKLRWSHACREASNERRRLDGAAPGEAMARQGVEEAVRRLLILCKGATLYSDVESVTAYQRSTSVAFSERLAETEGKHGVDAAIDFAESYLRNADGPFEMQAALRYLNATEVILPPEELWRADNPRRREEIFDVARDLYICDQFGGCGPSHVTALEYCMRTHCSKLGSYEGMVSQHVAPAEKPLLDWYINAFQALRG